MGGRFAEPGRAPSPGSPPPAWSSRGAAGRSLGPPPPRMDAQRGALCKGSAGPPRPAWSAALALVGPGALGLCPGPLLFEP